MTGDNIMSKFYGRYTITDTCISRDKSTFAQDNRLKPSFKLPYDKVGEYQKSELYGIGRTNGHGFAKAVVGGSLFGGIGAVAGLAAGRGKDKKMLYELTITAHNIYGATYYIDFFDMFNITAPVAIDNPKYSNMMKAYHNMLNFLKINKPIAEAKHQKKLDEIHAKQHN